MNKLDVTVTSPSIDLDDAPISMPMPPLPEWADIDDAPDSLVAAPWRAVPSLKREMMAVHNTDDEDPTAAWVEMNRFVSPRS